jgi:hypothetical protein
MIFSKRLVEMIERSADELTTKWIEEVRKHRSTPTYHRYDERKLYERAHSVYSQLGRWLSDETSKDDIQELYTALGVQRRKEGFDLSELITAFVITRRVLWAKIESEGVLDTALDLNIALQLSNQMLVFFDRAMVFAAQGYESASD